MPQKILVGYATRYGSTQEVAEEIAATMRQHELAVEVHPLREVRSLGDYRAVVIGAPLMMYRWHKDAQQFLKRWQKTLLSLPVAVFALGPVHDPHDEQEWQDSRAQLDKELANFPWFKPIDLAIFGGKFDPEKLGFPLNKLAGKEPATDIRDWEAIRAWATGLAGRDELRMI